MQARDVIPSSHETLLDAGNAHKPENENHPSPSMSWGNYPVLLGQTMADVRTLLQREREARRIQHPHLSYSKSGALTCVVCSLNVKSETLWEGHSKSANHRKNLRDASATSTSGAVAGGNGKKRKIEEVVEEENPRKRKTTTEEDEEEDLAGRKKRHVSFQVDELAVEQPGYIQPPEPHILPSFVKPLASAPNPAPVDESEWAAFLTEVTPLTAPLPATDPSAFTISAAPISASELAARQALSGRSRREEEAEDEKEESEQRLADEFDVMEEMEERVRRLKEKRESLRVVASVGVDGITVTAGGDAPVEEEAEKPPERKAEAESGLGSDSEDDADDWFL